MEEEGSKVVAARDFGENHVLLKALLDISGLLVVVLDDSGTICLFNQACERVTGFSRKDMLGKSIWSTLIPEDEVDDVRRIAERLSSGESDNEFTNHWLTRDGERRLICWRNTVLDSPDGSVAHIVGTGIDMTGEERAVRAREHADDQLLRLLDALPALVAHLDHRYCVRFANRGYKEWFGVNAEAQVGRHVRDVIGPKAFATLRPHFDQALSGENSVYHGKVEYLRGGTRIIHGTYIPAYDKDGRVDGLFILAVDITREHDLQWQLSEELQHSQTIVDNAFDGIVTINQEGSIRSFNPAAEEIFGYEASEVIGSNVAMLMVAPEGARHDWYIQNYLKTGQSRILGTAREVTGRHKEGALIDLQLAVAEFMDDEQLFIGFFRDIRQRKRAEREARAHLAELAHVTRVGALSELTAGLAHELSQPLTAIAANAEAGLMMCDAGDVESEDNPLRPLLEQVADQSKRAREIINQLRDFLRRDRSDQITRCCPEELVDHVMMLLNHEIESAGIQVRIMIDSGVGKCEVNRVQIEQVLFNLAKNAIDAMRETDGKRILSIECGKGDSGGCCEMRVLDTGPGIPRKHMERLFNPFFTTKEEGLGQGLSICRSIVERHGGTLSARNRSAGGMVFCFELPLCGDGDD